MSFQDTDDLHSQIGWVHGYWFNNLLATGLLPLLDVL